MTNKTKTADSIPAQEETSRMCEVAMSALTDAKGEQIRLLDVRKLTDITDYMIIATGTSDRHVKTLADRVLENMNEAGWKHLATEGIESSDWLLVDFVDVVVHIMRAQARERYDLESLWDESFGEMLTPPSDVKLSHTSSGDTS